METRATTVKKNQKYIQLESDSDHEIQEKITTELEDNFQMDPIIFTPFPQRIGEGRRRLLDEAICNKKGCVEDYQDGVGLIFTEQTLASLFSSLQYKSATPLNQLYSDDFVSIQAACGKNNDVPIRGFRFNHVLGQIQLSENRFSRAGTLQQLQLLLKTYGPFLMSLDLSNNQLTDAEGAGVMNVLSSVKSPLLHEINLSGNSVGRDTLEGLQSYLKKALLLRTLEVANCGLNDEQFKNLLSTLPQVQHVNACFNQLSHQTELFLREHLQMAYSPALKPDDWKKPCQELLNIALQSTLVSHAFLQEIPLLLKVREQQAKEWRDKHLFSVAGKKEMIFEAIRKGEVFWLEALVFARGYQVNVDRTELLSFKDYDQEIKVLEEKLAVLKTRHLEATEHCNLLEDQQQLLGSYLRKELEGVQGKDALRITNVSDLKKELENRLIAYREKKLNHQADVVLDEQDAHLGKELIQVQNEMQQEIQGDILQHYQFPLLASDKEVNRLYLTQQTEMKSFKAKMAEHEAQEAHYCQRYNDLINQKEERIQSWQISCIQGKLPLVWMRQLTDEQELRERLLNYPFDPCAIEEESGESLLHMAIRDDQLGVVELLLEAGVNIAICDRKGKTVIEAAIELNKKERRLLHLKAIITHMGKMKVDNNSLEPLFLLAYGKAAEEALRQMMDVCQHYGQNMIKRQELSGLKRFFDEIMSSASVRSARARELSHYWESLWKHASKGELRDLIDTWERVEKHAKSGFFGLSHSALHSKAQAVLKDLRQLYEKSPKIENDIKKAIKEQGIEEDLHHQISMRCQKIVQQSKKTEEACRELARKQEEERAIQEKKDADKLESDKKIKESGIEIEILKADKLESDKKIKESDKKIKESGIEIEILKADKLKSDKKFQESDKKFQESDKKIKESDKKIKESEIEIKTLKADMERRFKELMEAQQKKPVEESGQGLTGKAEQEKVVEKKPKHKEKKQEQANINQFSNERGEKKKAKMRLAPVEEASATSQSIEQQNLLAEKKQEQAKQKTPGGLNSLLLFGKNTIHKLKNDPATIRLQSSIPQ